ncbi:hypothetical protein [Campylobacter vulpis]|uniref:hypothetical protein n=1 Tax=Campylobacter vulpis TaxID=1655500 RepID=UPI001BCD5215|nr:hypothetical protein [Campylobacter vulpis]
MPDEYKHDLNFLLRNKYAFEKENDKSFNEFFTQRKCKILLRKAYMRFKEQDFDPGGICFRAVRI